MLFRSQGGRLDVTIAAGETSPVTGGRGDRSFDDPSCSFESQQRRRALNQIAPTQAPRFQYQPPRPFGARVGNLLWRASYPLCQEVDDRAECQKNLCPSGHAEIGNPLLLDRLAQRDHQDVDLGVTDFRCQSLGCRGIGDNRSARRPGASDAERWQPRAYVLAQLAVGFFGTAKKSHPGADRGGGFQNRVDEVTARQLRPYPTGEAVGGPNQRSKIGRASCRERVYVLV